MQLLEFPSVQALDEFMTDGRRQSLACERDRVIARTEVIEVQVVQQTTGGYSFRERHWPIEVSRFAAARCLRRAWRQNAGIV